MTILIPRDDDRLISSSGKGNDRPQDFELRQPTVPSEISFNGAIIQSTLSSSFDVQGLFPSEYGLLIRLLRDIENDEEDSVLSAEFSLPEDSSTSDYYDDDDNIFSGDFDDFLKCDDDFSLDRLPQKSGLQRRKRNNGTSTHRRCALNALPSEEAVNRDNDSIVLIRRRIAPSASLTSTNNDDTCSAIDGNDSIFLHQKRTQQQQPEKDCCSVVYRVPLRLNDDGGEIASNDGDYIDYWQDDGDYEEFQESFEP